jgi:NitT/TauT family transport system ATP-binding protein
LQERQDGRLLLDESDITGPGPDRAMIFQPPSLMPWRTVMGNVTVYVMYQISEAT